MLHNHSDHSEGKYNFSVVVPRVWCKDGIVKDCVWKLSGHNIHRFWHLFVRHGRPVNVK